MQAEYLDAGRIVGTHGVRGELRLEPWCDSPEFLQQFDTFYWQKDKKPVHVKNTRVHKHFLLLTIDGIDTLEQADPLRGRVLCFRRADAAPLPEGVYYQQDLIGLRVCDLESGLARGTLTAIFQTGANDVSEVTDQAGKKTLVPAIADVIGRISLEEGPLFLKHLEGLFDAD